jgi:hypothetical protein
VYRATVDEADVLAYIASRQEDEYIVRLPTSVKVTRVP